MSTSSSLFDEVTQLNQHFEENKDDIMQQRQTDLEEKRRIAREQALEAITKDCETKIKESAALPGRAPGVPRKETKLYEWAFLDNAQFNGCYVRDLLNKGELLEEIQAWFDSSHPGPEGSRVFKLYYTMLGGPNAGRNPETRRYAVFLSWDQEDWDRIDSIIQNTKDRFDNNRMRQQQPRMAGGGPGQVRGGQQRGGYNGSPQRYNNQGGQQHQNQNQHQGRGQYNNQGGQQRGQYNQGGQQRGHYGGDQDQDQQQHQYNGRQNQNRSPGGRVGYHPQ